MPVIYSSLRGRSEQFQETVSKMMTEHQTCPPARQKKIKWKIGNQKETRKKECSLVATIYLKVWGNPEK